MRVAKGAAARRSAVPAGVALVLAAALAAHGLSGSKVYIASGPSGNGSGNHVARHTAANRVINVKCPPNTPGSHQVDFWESTRTGPIFLKCASWRHFLRGHHPKGASAQEILDCIAKTIEYGVVTTYLNGAGGHLPSHVYEWNWDTSDSRLWTRVIVSLGEPGYITTAYPNAKRVLGDKGGDWRGCAAGEGFDGQGPGGPVPSG